MKITTKQVERLLVKAQKAWGLSEWKIEWQWADCSYEGDIEIRFTEKYALMSLDKSHITDKQNLARTVYHEVGHCLTSVIERNLSDFTEHYIKDKKAESVFWERLNTDQNIVLDWIVVKVMGV